MKTNHVEYTEDRIVKTSYNKEEDPILNSPPGYNEREPTIEEQKSQANFLFQIISHVDGRRSEPFVSSWDAVTEMLQKHEGTEVSKDDYLLLVATLDGENTRIPATPIIKVSTFLHISENPQEEK